MTTPRTPVFMALLLLIFSAGHSKPSAVPMGSKDEDVSLFQLIVDKVMQAKERQAEESDSQRPSRQPEHSPDSQDVQDYKVRHDSQVLEVFPRDLRQKEKFLKHLTGPLYFSPKCSKHFYRLYHNTRDCTIPAYYKRCARLLTRLAGSQRCMEG
ncbi:protein FAM150B-like [Scleropages formosus]|uniref:ALK and LTK ligand 2b n=1 Tax=Scleropages formosus TaxID=113540 RepID=A0A0P7XR48_SCLFO|nr:ALK and LTK ligand 2 [Scleropages formosus]XP_018586450.1 ALK and LTK ligand 2 [Scleropages formosus]KPP77883.1 protein FAM150B-like [Scleropages formosus]